MKSKFIRLLAIIGALCAHTAKSQESSEPRAGLTVLAATEQEEDKKNHTEITLKPDLKWEKGEYKVGYYGSFYGSKDSDDEKAEWKTLTSEIRAENDAWRLDIGRSSTCQYASCICAPTTTGFDNKGIGRGAGRSYTGAILTHKDTGLSLGQVANDTNVTFKHWDNLLFGWKKEFNDTWGLHLQATVGRRALLSAGATLRWKPTDTTSVVAEAFYKDHEKSAILAANHRLTDDLTLFAGGQMTSPEKGKSDGLATLGLNYHLGKGIRLIIAGQQKFGSERETRAILGIKYCGNFRQ